MTLALGGGGGGLHATALAIALAVVTAEPACRCLDSLAGFGVPSNNLTVTTSSGAFLYPSTYGIQCGAHDINLEPFCSLAGPAAFCHRRWCYVNASECSLSETQPTQYLAAYDTGPDLQYSYALCGSEDVFTSWFSVSASTLKLCSVFAKEDATDRPCGYTASHLQVEAMVGRINSLTGSNLGFPLNGRDPSSRSYYRFLYEYQTYPEGGWDALGANLSHALFPLCDVIVGQGHGCSDDDIQAQAAVAHAHKRIYFTMRGPRAVLSDPTNAYFFSRRLSPYFFSTHIRSDLYADVALREIAATKRAEAASGCSSGSGAEDNVRLAVLNFAHNAFYEGVGDQALEFAAVPANAYTVVYAAKLLASHDGEVCEPYNITTSDGSCTPLAAFLDEMLAEKPDVVVLASDSDGFGAVASLLSSRRPRRAAGESQTLLSGGEGWALRGLFWTGVPSMTDGVHSCDGYGDHCAHVLGATQISQAEADLHEDELLLSSGVPATYDWLRANNSALEEAYSTWVFKAEADAAIIPSIIAQAMQRVFHHRYGRAGEPCLAAARSRQRGLRGAAGAPRQR